MKKRLKTPKDYMLVGLTGFAICACLAYVAENLVIAPNRSTLIYWQSQIFLVILILFVVSTIFLAGGLWGAMSKHLLKRN